MRNVLQAKLQQQSSRLDSSMKFSGKQLEQLQHLLHKTKAAQTKATKELHGEEQELKVLETKLKSYQTTLHKLQHKLQADGLTPEVCSACQFLPKAVPWLRSSMHTYQLHALLCSIIMAGMHYSMPMTGTHLVHNTLALTSWPRSQQARMGAYARKKD